MSFTQPKPGRTRLQRSTLAVPASNMSMMEKASNSDADVVFLDCEDAVVPADKPEARKKTIEALNNFGWREKGITVCVRINSLDTHFMYRDVVDIVEQAGLNLDTILIPKVGTPADVYMVDAMLTQIEAAMGFGDHKIGIEALIETTLGMANVEAIAQSSPRLEALHFGVADFSASCRARTVNIGGLHPDYPGDQWHASLQRMMVACRAYGLRPIDGPFGDFSAPDDYVAAAKRVAAMGFEGKWAIHPSQIALANEVMSPPQAEIDRAYRVLEVLAEASAKGQGAAQLDGKMIDIASERMAQNVVNVAEQIKAKAKA